MGHLCFDWTIPSDHMLEKERQEQAQSFLKSRVGKGVQGSGCKYKHAAQGSFPSSHGARTLLSGRGRDSARAGPHRPSSPLLGRGSATENVLNLRHQRWGRHTGQETPARLAPHRTKAKHQWAHGKGTLVDRLWTRSP